MATNMDTLLTLDRAAGPATRTKVATHLVADDEAMLRAAAELTRALAPIGLLIRYAILSPLSVVVPGLRRVVVERFSALAINPNFRRRMPDGAFRTQWIRIEAAASVWGIALLALVASGVVPLRAFL